MHPSRKFNRNVELKKLVSTETSLPTIIHNVNPNMSLPDYLAKHRSEIDEQLEKSGAILCRGFHVTCAEEFSDSIAQLSSDILNYTERSSPRHSVADKVYTSTDHPADQHIMMHSEQSYTLDWPCLICFYCKTKAAAGGNTPLANNRRIINSISDELRQKFMNYGILYKRVYSSCLGIDWRTAFQTDDPKQVESFCRERSINFQWKGDNILRTEQHRSAFQLHPTSNHLIWFNHALFFNISSLDEKLSKALIESVGIENVPTNTFFGNGEPFSDTELQELRNAVAANTISFDWQEGDVLILDNMLTQHGREPFTGQRDILTLMARPYGSLSQPMLNPYITSLR